MLIAGDRAYARTMLRSMPMPHIRWISVTIAALACLAGACKKDSRERERVAKPITQTPFEAGYKTLSDAAPPGDVLAVLLRFDHLQAFGLADEVDALVGILPDHRRVFGGSGGIPGTFDVVYISTADPAVLIASTLAARTLKPADMRTMLAYPGAGVTWHEAPGGHLGKLAETERFSWYDPRVYLMPGDPWIVLARPEQLGSLADPTRTDPPKWVAAAPSLAKLGTPDERPGKLLAVASASNLPRTGILPAVGTATMPTRMIAAATAHDKTVVFTGDMTFASEQDARIATDTLATLRMRFERFRPVRELKVQRQGATIMWITQASVTETATLTDLAANLVRPMFPDAQPPQQDLSDPPPGMKRIWNR